MTDREPIRSAGPPPPATPGRTEDGAPSSAGPRGDRAPRPGSQRRREHTESAREVAYRALQRIDHGGAYANLVVPALLRESKLDERDRAFVTDLVYGTTRMRRACDALVDRFVLDEPSPEIRTLLRLGAYQIQYTNVPPHAAVSETVDLTGQRFRGFVNAVLRNVLRTPMIWPDLETELSYPDWLSDRLRSELGDDDATAAMRRMNEPPPVTARDDGYVQDRASQWVAGALDAQAGERVLDVCAAPGGKATALASTGAYVVAADISPVRAGLIRQNVERLGADVSVVVADGCVPPYVPGAFDRVLLDAPCSGLGALRRRPDARWRIQPVDIDELIALQRDILHQTADLVGPGGVLLYSVCTITAGESIDHPVPAGFEIDDEHPPAGTWRRFGRGWRVLPHDDDTDGMVLVRYRRTA